MHKAMLLAVLLAGSVLAGCTDNAAKDDETFQDPVTYVPGKTTSVTIRQALPFNVTGQWSQVLEKGPFGILDGISQFVNVPLALTEGGSAVLGMTPADGPPMAHLGLFLPDIPGCDWNAATLPEECHVPVIADAGPYYTESDVDADQRGSGRLGEFLIGNFVPHGYAVAQISVMGSGRSTHCFDMFGLAEQLGVHHAVEWLGSQPWSNGNVGLIGRSYDGSTPWMAAAHASPGSALKTIVPISGLHGLSDLVTWNGASESRVLTFHNVIYGTFGLTPDNPPVFAQQVARRATCPDWVTATPWGAASLASGDHVVDVEGSYWEERSFLPRAIANYRGSVYMIHGFLDSNVDPHAGWPGQLLFETAGLDVKGLWGQWFHSYPDRPGEHGINNQGNFIEPRNSVRYDWGQDLLEWFDYYLKETGEKPSLHVEVQQYDGRWRIDDKMQPTGSEFLDLPLAGADFQVSPATGVTTLDLGVLDADQETILGGLSSIKLRVTPTGPGGQIHVELVDLTDGHDFGLSYGVMELRHARGQFQPVAPGQPMDIVIPFQYFSGALPAGNRLGLEVSASGNGFLPSPVVAPVTVHASQSSVSLSVAHPAPSAYFEPPIWWDEAPAEA